MQLQSGNYVLFSGVATSTAQLCLGIGSIAPTTNTALCTLQTFSDSTDVFTWYVATVPGTVTLGTFYMQHLSSGLALCMSNNILQVKPFDPTNPGFLIHLVHVNWGLVRLSSAAATGKVMDANGNNPGAGAPVTPYVKNDGTNQQWRFVSTAMWDNLP